VNRERRASRRCLVKLIVGFILAPPNICNCAREGTAKLGGGV